MRSGEGDAGVRGAVVVGAALLESVGPGCGEVQPASASAAAVAAATAALTDHLRPMVCPPFALYARHATRLSPVGPESVGSLVCVTSPASPDNPSVATLAAMVDAAPAGLPATAVVLVDGPAGSGKTTLANRLARALAGLVPGDGGGTDASGAGDGGTVLRGPMGGAQLLHGDDMYEGWSGLSTLDRVLVGQVLEPLSRGTEGAFRAWDWERGERGLAVAVPPREYLVIEGVGVAQAAARAYAALTVFVDAPWQLRLERGLARDGEAMRDHWERWQVDEARFLEADGTRAAANVLIDGTAPIPDA